MDESGGGISRKCTRSAVWMVITTSQLHKKPILAAASTGRPGFSLLNYSVSKTQVLFSLRLLLKLRMAYSLLFDALALGSLAGPWATVSAPW